MHINARYVAGIIRKYIAEYIAEYIVEYIAEYIAEYNTDHYLFEKSIYIQFYCRPAVSEISLPNHCFLQFCRFRSVL